MSLLNASARWSDWNYVSRRLLVKWRKPGGDWADKAGVLNGPEPTISKLVPSLASVDVDIAAIDGDLLLQGTAAAFSAITIDGVAVESFWTSPSNTNTLPLPSKWVGHPIVVLNPARGRTLTVTPTSASVGKTLRIDRLSPPPRPLPPPYVGPPGDDRNLTWKIPLKDQATLLAWFKDHGYIVSPEFYAWSPEFGVDATYGFEYIRVASRTDMLRLIAWFPRFPGTEEMWARWLIMPERDFFEGYTEGGMKNPGLIHYDGNAFGLSWRTWHGGLDPRNPGIYQLSEMLHATGDDRQGWPDVPDVGAWLHEDVWNEVKQHGKLNKIINVDPVTNLGTGLYDGVAEVWHNGRQIINDRARKWRRDPRILFDTLHVDLYHGGQHTYPAKPFHVRLAEIVVSPTDPGATPRLFISLPPENPPMAPDAISVRDKCRAAYDESCDAAGTPNVQAQIDAAVAGSAQQIATLTAERDGAVTNLANLKAAVNVKLDEIAAANVAEDAAEGTQDAKVGELRGLVA